MVLEYCKGTTIGEYLKRIKDEKIDENKAKMIFKEILLGVQHIHSLNVYHWDLKLENIMIEETRGKFICKIIDFGFAVHL